MLNDEEIKALTEEQKTELISKLSFKEETKVEEVKTEEVQNELEGGKGDGKTLENLAEVHKVDVKTLEAELEKGIAVELEHTTDKEKAREIAMDHLTEKADYYETLKKVENEDNPLETLKVELQSEITKFKEETLETFKKELSLKDEVITSLQNDIAELKRTQPTGVPGTKYTLGTNEQEKTQEKESLKNSYYSGSRYQH